MAMSDCLQCWNTPCNCGHDWEKFSLSYLLKHQQMIGEVILKKIASASDQKPEDGK